jgi:hypothetical protein
MIPTNEKLMAIFETMAQHLGIQYERVEVRQLIAAGEVVGADPLGALYRVAERYRIRLGVFDGTLTEALAFANQDYPVAVAPSPLLAPDVSPPIRNSSRLVDQETADAWWVLLSARGRSAKVWSTRTGAEPEWVRLRQLRQMLGLQDNPDATLRLVVANRLTRWIMLNNPTSRWRDCFNCCVPIAKISMH